jgi:queuine tRNA-ribosyltransferase
VAAECTCPACREHTRAYLHYLVRAGELTAVRLLTLHNLTFMAALMKGIGEALHRGRFGDFAAAVERGEGPYPAV